MKLDADASRIVADTAVGLLQPLRDEADGLRREIRDLRIYVGALTDLLRNSNIPIPQPPTRDKMRQKNGRRHYGRTTDYSPGDPR
jgi:hypothetical protein